ncbi:slit homolog 3 protein-like [Dreissena polymorpha]|uniref:slit homolog 3 protein-like n=1 Tax=Dreissena polymorpha TaxID=45954 RepID=UPI002264B1E3|nr:slit homolog 3 protein-like [Dreissena polymorpha]
MAGVAGMAVVAGVAVVAGWRRLRGLRHGGYLHNNRIRTIHRAAFRHLTNLYLANNPLICDCQLQWLIETVQDSQSNLRVNGAECSEPAHLKGRNMVHVTQADLNCDTQANDTNECVTQPCKNGAKCTNLQNTYSCTCSPGWQGHSCDQDINECVPAPCKNGATCTNLQNAYSCTCSPGWQGFNCDQDINECAPAPCKNDGTCANLQNAYSCTCSPGWQGNNCDQDINECAPAPCKNGATCSNLQNAYSCTCVPGWQGNNCDKDINECAKDPCKNGTTCIDLQNAYLCTCVHGWQGNNCDKACPTMKFGINCAFDCGNCLHNLCDHETGLCTSGCKPGFLSTYCRTGGAVSNLITYSTDKTITVWWNRPDEPSVGIVAYKLMIYNTFMCEIVLNVTESYIAKPMCSTDRTSNQSPNSLPLALNQKQMNVTFSGLKPDTNYILYVMAYTEEGIGEIKNITLKTQIALPVPVEKPAGLNLWFIALIVGILVLIVVVLIMCYKYRNRGGTSPLHTNKKKAGNNPEQELNDTVFQDLGRVDDFNDASSDVETGLNAETRPFSCGSGDADCVKGSEFVEDGSDNIDARRFSRGSEDADCGKGSEFVEDG